MEISLFLFPKWFLGYSFGGYSCSWHFKIDFKTICSDLLDTLGRKSILGTYKGDPIQGRKSVSV